MSSVERAPARQAGGRYSLAGQLESERARWFCWAPVFVGLGVLVYFALPFEPGLIGLVAVLIAFLALRAVWREGTYACVTGAILVAVATGLVAVKVRSEMVATSVVPHGLQEGRITGFVELVESREAGGIRLTLRPTSIEGLAPAAVPGRVRVSVKEPGDAGVLVGDHVGLDARLVPPPVASVPGGFDFARHAFYKGIGGVGFAKDGPVATQLDESVERSYALEAANAVARLRQGIGQRVQAALPGQTGAVAVALITGERSGIAEETNEAYRASGLFHILSISGLHMAIMGGAVFFATRFVLAAIPSVALRFPIKKWAAIGAICGSFGYLLISGGSYPTIRSFLMISVFFVSILLDRPALAMRNVAIAALGILLIFPESAIDPGFQMSFAAVIALVSGFEFVARRSEPLLLGASTSLWRLAGFFGAIVGSTLIASVAVAPLGIFHFHQAQHFSVLANVLAVPICNLVVMPAALASLMLMPFGAEAWALQVMGPGIDAMGSVAQWVAGLDGAVSHVPAISVGAMSWIAAGGLWVCLFEKPWRLLGIAGIAVGVVLSPMAERPDILVGDEGRLVMVRAPSGELAGLVSRSGTYELTQWLARDGDAREAGEVGPANVLQCDRLGCFATVKGVGIAISKTPASLRDDCRRARIVVLRYGAGSAECIGPDLVVDRKRARREGTRAIYIDDEGLFRSQTVREVRGERPWTGRSDSGS